MKTRWMKKVMVFLMAAILLAGCAAAAEEVVGQKLNTLYSLAVGYIGREDYDKAMQYLDAALDICQEEINGEIYADLHLKKACVYTIRKSYEDAIAELDESIRVRPEVAEAYLVKVQVYSETEDIAKAAENLEKYIELSGDNGMNDTLAQMYLQLEEKQKAEDSYRRLAEAVTEDPALLSYNLALYEINAQMYAEALANLQSCEADPEKVPALHYNTGVCQMMLGSYAEAIEAFTASLEKEDFIQDATYNRAICSMSLQQFEPAITDFTVYIDGLTADSAEQPAENAEETETVPEQPAETAKETETPAEQNEGTAEQTEEAAEPAEETAEVTEETAKAAEETPETQAEIIADIAYYYRGVCYLSILKYAEAIADFTVCIDSGLNVNESLFNRALSSLQNGNFEEAKADFTACIEGDYLTDEALYYRSFAFRYLEDNESALADLTACVEHGYDLGQVYTQRAAVYQAMGDEDNYLKDLEASLEYLED